MAAASKCQRPVLCQQWLEAAASAATVTALLTLCTASNAATITTNMRSHERITGCLSILLLLHVLISRVAGQFYLHSILDTSQGL